MVFVLDNYDSFTYNLVQYLGELGAKVEVRRNDQITPAEVEAMHPERILLSPGPCTPQEAGITIPLIRHFAGKVLPLLKEKCFACHGDDPKKIKGKFDLRTRESLMRGGESGDAV